MRTITLTQYKQDARISTEKCVAAHSAAGSWHEQRARDAVEHLPTAAPFGMPEVHRHATIRIVMRFSLYLGLHNPSASTKRAHVSTDASSLRRRYISSASKNRFASDE